MCDLVTKYVTGITSKLFQWNSLCQRLWPYKITVQPCMFSSELLFSFATVKLFHLERFAMYGIACVWSHRNNSGSLENGYGSIWQDYSHYTAVLACLLCTCSNKCDKETLLYSNIFQQHYFFLHTYLGWQF